MDETVKGKLEDERRNLQRQLTRSIISEDEQLALQTPETKAWQKRSRTSLRPADGIQHRPTEGSDQQAVGEEKVREQVAVNDRREATLLHHELGPVPYTVPAQTMIPGYGPGC